LIIEIKYFVSSGIRSKTAFVHFVQSIVNSHQSFLLWLVLFDLGLEQSSGLGFATFGRFFVSEAEVPDGGTNDSGSSNRGKHD